MKTGLKLGAALAVIVLAGGLAACSKEETQAPASEKAAETPKTVYGSWGVDTTQGDLAVRPGDDFARYANGKWLDTFEIPADLPGYVSFTKLSLDAEDDIKAIVEELGAKPSEKGSLEQQVGGFYKSWMDEAAVEALGATFPATGRPERRKCAKPALPSSPCASASSAISTSAWRCSPGSATICELR